MPCIIKEIVFRFLFVIFPPPFWGYYSTVLDVFQDTRGAKSVCASPSRRRRVYHPQLVAVYHQCEALYIIKPQKRCTLTRDEIQGRRAALDDIHDCVVMICQACGLDKKILVPKNEDFLSRGYEKDIFCVLH